MTHSEAHRASALDVVAVLALVITFSLRYAPFLASRLLFGPFIDNVHIYGPIFSEVSRLASSGSVPYYLPDIGTGFPVFESPHFSILYPFYFFGLLNYGGPLASLYTLTNLTLLHIFVFYLNLYVLLRCATITPWASYIGASVGMLARNTELYASWITIAASYAWLPLVLAGGVLLLRSPGKTLGIFIFSIAASLLALASPSQSVIHAALSCLILFGTGAAWMCLQRRFADVWRLAWSVAVCACIAIGLAGVAVIPMYVATGEMIRHIGAGAAVIGHASIPWENFNLIQLRLDQATGIVVRPAWISIVGSPYIGPLGLIGTLLIATYFRRLDGFLRMLAVGFGIIGIYGLLSGFGTNLGLAYLNFHLPLVNRIREAGRFFVLFVIAVSFLSGLGYSLLARRVEGCKELRDARWLIPGAILMLLFLGIIFWEFFLGGADRMQSHFWILLLAPIVYVLGSVSKLSGYKYLTLAALFVSVAAVVIPVRGFQVSESSFDKPMNLLSHRVIQSFADKIDTAGYRVDFRDKAFSHRLWAMNASYYGIKSFYNGLTPQPYGQYYFSNLTNVPHLREMMGARYVLCGRTDSPTDQDAKEILETEGYRLYENSKPMGRITLVHQVAGSIEKELQFIRIIRKGFDYFSEAYLTAADFDAAQKFLENSQGLPDLTDQIKKLVDQPNRSYSAVESDSASLLILNEWFTPSWKVRVNGQKQPVLRVNQWQTGVLLPAGKNLVEFEYHPTLFRALMALHRITFVLLLLFAIFHVVRKARGSDSKNQHAGTCACGDGG